MQLSYVKLFNALFDETANDLPDLIRKLKTFVYAEPPVRNKISTEKAVHITPNILDPNFAFKKDNITGYLCHIIRDLVFHTGCVCNASYVMPESNNTVQHYRYLMDKKAYFQTLKHKLNAIFKK